MQYPYPVTSISIKKKKKIIKLKSRKNVPCTEYTTSVFLFCTPHGESHFQVRNMFTSQSHVNWESRYLHVVISWSSLSTPPNPLSLWTINWSSHSFPEYCLMNHDQRLVIILSSIPPQGYQRERENGLEGGILRCNLGPKWIIDHVWLPSFPSLQMLKIS